MQNWGNQHNLTKHPRPEESLLPVSKLFYHFQQLSSEVRAVQIIFYIFSTDATQSYLEYDSYYDANADANYSSKWKLFFLASVIFSVSFFSFNKS